MSAKESKLVTLKFVGISAIVTIALVEVILRFYFSIHNDFDIEMWKYSTELKTPTKDARLHKHVADSKAHLMGVDVKISPQGNRGKAYAYVKPENTFRILALGDSFTFGWGVPEDATFLSLMDRKLSQSGLFADSTSVEVINAGIGNYNTQQELAAFEIEGRKYSPDVVILFFYLNDAEPAQHIRMNWFERSSYAYVLLRARIKRLRSYFASSFNYREYYEATLQGEAWVKYSTVLGQAVEAIRVTGARPLVVLLPDLRRPSVREFAAVYSKIETLLAERGVPVLNLEGKLMREPATDYWVAFDDPHPNALAHKELAELIYDFFVKDFASLRHAN